MRLHLDLRRILVGAAILLGASCHDSPTVVAPPSTPFDASHALARFDPLAAVFDQPIFKSFDASLSFFEGYFRSMPNDTPDAVRGRTFVYDVPSRSYVVDASATGAPANGVRYVLYDWAPGAGGPALPLVRIGYTDIAPLPSLDGQLTEIVLFRDRPFLVPADFVVKHVMVNGVNVFSITGSATDGITSDDNIVVDGSESGADGHHLLVYNTTIASTSLGVSSVEQLTFDQANASQSGALDLRYEGHRFSDQTVSAGTEVKFDGLLYARVFFPATPNMAPRYIKTDGTPLAEQEIAALNALLERAQVASFFWVDLAYP